MANKLDPMDLKQIITLHTDGLSNRKIGDLLNISRNTVNNYMKMFKVCDHDFPRCRACPHAWLMKQGFTNRNLESLA